MSKTYTIVAGDTFELISRKVYGTEIHASKIAKANPGVNEPLKENALIVIPNLTEVPKNTNPEVVTDDKSEVALLIDNKRFRFWTDINISRALDNIDTVEFRAPFDSTNKEFKETFKPFSYKDISVYVGGKVIFTGTMININPVLESNSKAISVSCYSLPGVLNDCHPPASAFPVEYFSSDLKTIAKAIAAPFGIDAVFNDSPGAVFDIVAADVNQTVLSFLSELAKQRNFVISNTADGNLLFHRSISIGKPVATFEQGVSPLLSVTPIFNPQYYFSDITGLEPTSTGLEGTQYTVKNKRLSGVLRPNTFNVPDTPTADIETATKARMGRMFGNVVSYSVAVNTWRDANGDLWSPNTIVTLLAPDSMVYTEYNFVIRSVDFTRSNDAESAVLNLVIPGSFEGKVPESLPWEE